MFKQEVACEVIREQLIKDLNLVDIFYKLNCLSLFHNCPIWYLAYFGSSQLSFNVTNYSKKI